MKGIKLKFNHLVIFLTLLIIFIPTTAEAATSNAINTTRIYGNDRYETAAKIAEAGWPKTSNYAILAPGLDSNLIDALTAGPLAAKLNAPILLSEEDSLNNFAQQELTRLAVKTVFITMTTGPGVDLQNLIKQVKAIPTVKDVEVLGGSDESQTSVNIANELTSLGDNINKAIVVGGSGVDALSISSIAGAQGMPILYSSGNSLSNCVSNYLNGLKSSLRKTYVIGGTGVISDVVASQLPGSVERVAGIDRYDTNIQVLKSFASILKYKNTYLANGETLVDALAVSPLAAQSCSPILLTSQSLPSPSAAYAQADLSPNLVALGGESVVPSKVLAQLSSQQVLNQYGILQGTTDPIHPSPINSVLTITGNNVTLINSTTNDSIILQGNNASFNNVTSKGTIFVDPGATGIAHLQNVTADNIVILSGSSIDLQNVISNALTIESSNNVYIKSSGNTTIDQTTLTSSANLDNSLGGSFGQIKITRASQPDPTPSVKFTGTFTQPVTVSSAAVIASPSASMANVVVDTDNSSQTVMLQGTFSSVTVNSPSNVTLGSNTTVQTLANNANAKITVPTSSSITHQTGSNPTGSNPTGSNPTGSNPTGSNPTGSNPTGGNPTGSNQTGSNQTGSNPTGSNQTGSNPTGSNPTGSNPTGSNPIGSNPTGSNQTGSNPIGSNPTGSNPTGSNQTGVYFGEDSGTSSDIYGNDFYVGQLGYGTHEHFKAATGGDDAGGIFFNGTGAANATCVYGYWLVSGLSAAPKGTSAAEWGQQQAQAAIKAFNDMRNDYGSKAKLVIFADIEACAGGLDTQDYTNNQTIYTAFVNWINQNSSAKPGTYSSPYEWNTLTMGPNFKPLTSGYYWLADYPGGTPDQSKLTTSNQFWVNFPQTNEQAQLWQFEGTPDYDVARVLPG